jgi:hypothetical protein
LDIHTASSHSLKVGWTKAVQPQKFFIFKTGS